MQFDCYIIELHENTPHFGLEPGQVIPTLNFSYMLADLVSVMLGHTFRIETLKMFISR